MSLGDSYRQLRDGFVKKGGMSPSAARRAANVFFGVVAIALVGLIAIGSYIAIRDPLNDPAARVTGAFVTVSAVLGVAIASLGRRLTPFPVWLKLLAGAGLTAALATAYSTREIILPALMVLFVAAAIIFVGLTSRP